MKLLFFISTLFLSTNSYSEIIGKVTKVRGEATILFVGQRDAKKITNGMNIQKDSSILTQVRSFVQVELNDKSKINIGPNSKMNIDKLEKSEAGFLTLLKGNMRAQVEKGQTNEEKLLIKTRTAALGVRGTDFQTIYNPGNNITNLITFKGEVALAKVENDSSKDDITKALRKNDVTLVSKAKFATVSDNLKEVTIPIKISPEQFTKLKINKELSKEDSNFNNDDFQKELKNTLALYREISIEEKSKNIEANKEIDQTKGTLRPVSGGLVDLESGVYISPVAKKENFNKALNIYEAKEIVGTVSASGSYTPPKGVTVDQRLGLVVSKEASAEVKQALSEVNKEVKTEVKAPSKPSLNDLDVDVDAYDKYYKK